MDLVPVALRGGGPRLPPGEPPPRRPLSGVKAGAGPAFECSAILDICRIRNIGSVEQLSRGRNRLVRIVRMLAKLARNR